MIWWFFISIGSVGLLPTAGYAMVSYFRQRFSNSLRKAWGFSTICVGSLAIGLTILVTSTFTPVQEPFQAESASDIQKAQLVKLADGRIVKIHEIVNGYLRYADPVTGEVEAQPVPLSRVFPLVHPRREQKGGR